MKNKGLTYLLGVAVLAIWGIVFYRIFNAVGPDNDPVRMPVREVADFKEEVAQDSFTLIGNYRDPFLGGMAHGGYVRPSVQRPQVQVKNTVKPAPVVKEQEPPMDWSFISYHGTISNPSNNKKVLLISVNGRQYMATESETIEGVTIVKNFVDSIQVSYQGKTHSIYR